MSVDKQGAGRASRRRKLGHTVLPDECWSRIGEALGLSGRQLQIVQCIFDDHVEARIALELGISEHTVHTHVERLYRKLGVSSRCELLVSVFAEHLARTHGVTPGESLPPESRGDASVRLPAESSSPG